MPLDAGENVGKRFPPCEAVLAKRVAASDQTAPARDASIPRTGVRAPAALCAWAEVGLALMLGPVASDQLQALGLLQSLG